MKMITIKKLKDFIYENYHRQIEFLKRNSYYSMTYQRKKDFLLFATKLIEKTSDANNTKQYYQYYLKKIKLVKRSKIITQEPKAFNNSNIVDIKSVTIEHSKTSYKLAKTIRLVEKVSQVGSCKNPDRSLQ